MVFCEIKINGEKAISILTTSSSLRREPKVRHVSTADLRSDGSKGVVNKDSDNVYRIQVKSKNDTKPWSAIYFRGIKEKAHKSWFFILYEEPTNNFYIVPSLQLAKLDADKKGFSDGEGKYCGKWGLLE